MDGVDGVGQGQGDRSRIEAAVARLDAAVGRLENAAAHAAAGDLRLTGELREARDEAEGLRDAHQAVAERLDAAIGRLRTLLGEE